MSVKICNNFARTVEEILAEYLPLLRICTPSSSLPHEFEVCVLSWSNLQKKIFDLALRRREFLCCSDVKGGYFIVFKIFCALIFAEYLFKYVVLHYYIFLHKQVKISAH